jgi:hypothetical protein
MWVHETSDVWLVSTTMTAAAGGRVHPPKVTRTPTGVPERPNGRPWWPTIRRRLAAVVAPDDHVQHDGLDVIWCWTGRSSP